MSRRLPPRHWLQLAASLAMLSALAACGSGGGSQPVSQARSHYSPSRYYPPPGPRDDPWGPYIREASTRFNFPEPWVRHVMHQESSGQEDVISWAGAMGLMQVMPDTYNGLRSRYNLGDDPFDPHNNILAGTAYLREMYDRFGSPGFLAAYNAGPNRLDSYLTTGRPLPDETVNYVASIAPLLGTDVAMTGPLAVYGGGGGTQYASRAQARPTPAGCDPDAAYNPNGPCTPLRAQSLVIAAAYTPVARPESCDPDAAYDPTRRCRPAPAPVAAPSSAPVVAQPPPRGAPVRPPVFATASPAPVYATAPRPVQERMARLATFTPGPPPGRWAIQVGTFGNLATAQAAADKARSALPELLRTAKVELPATTPFGSKVAFSARLAGLTPTVAADACSHLGGRGMACMTVSPERGSF